MTWYDILEVSPNASKEVIDMAYKALAKKHHPDLNPLEIREQCEDNMKLLNQARDILTDMKLRAEYDNYLYNYIDNGTESEQESSPSTETKEENTSTQYYISEPRPWVRYFARMIDINISSFLIVAIWSGFSPDSYNALFGEINYYLSNIIIYVIWLFVESILISLVGTTPGKWVFNTNVKSVTGANVSFPVALKRSFTVFLMGLGFLIPLVNLVTLYKSYETLKNPLNSGLTAWDYSCQTVVTTKKLNKFKIFIFLVLIIGIYAGLIYYNATIETQQNELNVKLTQMKSDIDKETESLIQMYSDLEDQMKDINELESSLTTYQSLEDTEQYDEYYHVYSDKIDDFNTDSQYYESRRTKLSKDIVDYNNMLLDK